jgi:D-glycero-alpha-D-manno-heptose-7-phosphate kinase
MIITKTPFRISLFGGGTDHPAWFKNHGGEVISFTIDKFCYLTTRILPPFFDYKYRVLYSKVETVKSINEIAHPAVRESIRKFCPGLSLEIHHDGDLPARTGIGSSSAFAVGLIHSLLLLNGSAFNNSDLANKAIELEQNDLLENVGSQDQIACAIGGMNYITFGRDMNWNAQKIEINKDLEDSIMDRIVLIYTGISRNSSDIQSHLIIDLDKKLKVMSRSIELARECKNIIQNYGDLDLIGEMLAESWVLKKEMNKKAVTKELDLVWDKAKAAGALGGKVLGAGGGGFCLFWVKSGKREEFLKKFNFGLHVPIKMSALGTQCVLK